MHVASIGQVFVKATRFLQPSRVQVQHDGIRHDRLFALMEESVQLVDPDQHRTFVSLEFDYDAESERLRLTFPDGGGVEGPALGDGRRGDMDYFGLRILICAEMSGPWGEALSAHAGRPMRLVRCLSVGRAIDVFPITLLTTGSLTRLAREVGAPVDAARFRAGFVIEQPTPHAEDGWDGRKLRVGEALVRIRSSVPRCAVPGFNPRDGARDQDVARALVRNRAKVSVPDGLLPGYTSPGFASYAEVLEPGAVTCGDRVGIET
jgi:uncharacterized protein YcbX